MPSTGQALEPWRRASRKLRKWAGKDLGLTIRTARREDALIAVWWSDLPNWGDIVNPVLIRHLSGHDAVPYDRVINIARHPVYSVVGSVLDRMTVPNLHVWGSGFKRSDGRFRLRPRCIHAVRGPLTREAVLRQGLPCPAVYGDPALLFPRIYRPERTRRYALGVIPHYVDRDDPRVSRFRERDDVLVIDILAGVEPVADQICRCAAVVSSSLHGMILADAYGIPSAWIEFSDGVEGDGFKFRDYLAGAGRPALSPLRVRADTTVNELLDHVSHDPIDVDLDRLLAACPFAERCHAAGDSRAAAAVASVARCGDRVGGRTSR
jgi:pyruvyltransferase